MKNMTALVCCFSRGYHYIVNDCRIFSDSVALNLLSDEEYNNIVNSMTTGIKFFNPGFNGTNEEALRWIVDNQLSPSILGRSAFCENALKNAIKIGCKQYLIFASGYDTFAYRNGELLDKISLFEIDQSEMIKDKKERLLRNNYDLSHVNFVECDFTKKDWDSIILDSNYYQAKISFCSLLGISYYLTKEEFEGMISKISNLVSDGSSLVFDYPTVDEGIESEINAKLAASASEEMKSKYDYEEIEALLERHGFLIYEHLTDIEMTQNYFEEYNTSNPNNKMMAPKGVNYCLCVKKTML